MTHGTDGMPPHAEADPLCQVCGTPLDGRILWCRHCDTPHHADCWEFNGGCSTFGCGSKRSTGRPPGPPTPAGAEPIVLTIDAAAPSDDAESPFPMVADEAVTVPRPLRLRLLELPGVRPLGRLFLLAGAVVLVLPALLARGVGIVGSLAFRPGMAVMKVLFALAEDDLHRDPTSGSLLGALVGVLFGRQVRAALNAVAALVACVMILCGLLQSELGIDWVTVPLVAYLGLTPVLGPLLNLLARVPIPDLTPNGASLFDTPETDPWERHKAEQRRRRKLPATTEQPSGHRPSKAPRRRSGRRRRNRRH